MFTLQAQKCNLKLDFFFHFLVEQQSFDCQFSFTGSSDPKLHKDLIISEKNIYLSSVT